jgi:glycine/D-amino acid oxidase-like deaminating enzyme
MVALMNHSIDLLEDLAAESGNVFRMNRRGYLYLTGDQSKVSLLEERASRPSSLGAGPVRIHTLRGSSYQTSAPDGYLDAPLGADLLLGGDLIRRHFPGISEGAVAALHVRRAGWLSAQQLGMHLLDSARRLGVEFAQARVIGLATDEGKISTVELSTGETISTGILVNAAGPYLGEVARLAGVDLPVHTELHLKVAFKDTLGIIDRAAPLLIWDDPQLLPWEPDERKALAADDSTRWLTEPFPSGAHTRPEGGPGSEIALMLWEYRPVVMEPVWPAPLDPSYPEVVLRGLATMLPGLRRYFGRSPRPVLDGGYYTKTMENRPLVGPMGPEGIFVAGALSGYGIMSACAVGDLLAAYITGAPLPDYAPAFALERYDDPAYVQRIRAPADSGQL